MLLFIYAGKTFVKGNKFEENFGVGSMFFSDYVLAIVRKCLVLLPSSRIRGYENIVAIVLSRYKSDAWLVSKLLKCQHQHVRFVGH